ncbi:MAG: universal stress protein [Saprospirales bacterium]|nr:universal stress protein [Saprospirales bacterium]MBK8921003.1 universal stress protein [Saprospirales bacterium]
MKSILVPTDFSKCAANAMQHALTLARDTGARVTVLHVVFPNEGVDNNVYNVFWSDEYMAERIKGLDHWVKKFQRQASFQKVQIKTECQIGFPVPAICDVADGVHADLIVMGTTGATGLRGAFLGSIAAGVLSKTQRPLLSIPKRAVAGDAKNAVFATDFRFKPDERSLAVLREMMTLRKSKLHIVHIMDKPGEYRDTVQEQALSQKLAGIPHDFHYLHDRDIAQAVSNFIESTDAGTLIAIAHEHSLLHRLFFDSITRRLAHRIHVPMLTLHDAGN